MTEEKINELRLILFTQERIRDVFPKESIMEYDGRVCDCDDNFLCSHRLEWLITWLKENT